jgi:DNA-binding response OmpR family regulator
MPKVLVADDSLSVRKVIERLLTAAGLEVALAANGAEAMAGLASATPDLIIADVIMPDKTGFEVCTHVRSHATLSATPILLISGVVDEEITRQAAACHADGVIKKPFQGTSLQDRVLALLASRRPQTDVPCAEAGVPSSRAITNSAKVSDCSVQSKIFRIREDQLEKVREAAIWAREIEERYKQDQKRLAELEEQTRAFRETALLAAARIHELESKLLEEEKRSTSQAQRIAEMEHAAACAQKLAAVFAEIGRLGQ